MIYTFSTNFCGRVDTVNQLPKQGNLYDTYDVGYWDSARHYRYIWNGKAWEPYYDFYDRYCAEMWVQIKDEFCNLNDEQRQLVLLKALFNMSAASVAKCFI